MSRTAPRDEETTAVFVLRLAIPSRLTIPKLPLFGSLYYYQYVVKSQQDLALLPLHPVLECGIHCCAVVKGFIPKHRATTPKFPQLNLPLLSLWYDMRSRRSRQLIIKLTRLAQAGSWERALEVLRSEQTVNMRARAEARAMGEVRCVAVLALVDSVAAVGGPI